MSNLQLISGVFIFGVTAWLGLYLISRDPLNLLGWFAGGSALSASFGMYVSVIENYAPAIRLAQMMVRWRQAGIIVAFILWFLFLIRLIPREPILKERFDKTPKAMLMILVGSLVFSIGLIWVFLPFGLSIFYGMVAVNLVVIFLGFVAAYLISVDLSETFWPDITRAFDYAFFMALLFGGQVVLVMVWATGVNFVMLNLLFGTILTAVIVQIFAMRFAAILDRIAFYAFPLIREKREELRAGVDAVARVDQSVDLLKLPQDEFAKLTRRAISEMGNLPKLAANPLTQLPLVAHRLAQKEVPSNTLAQANELKQLLKVSIERLKPRVDDPFGTTDEWRHFNALYFPYVAGLRPYRRYVATDTLSPTEREALTWFRAEVPTRTLYNWQNDAAKLIARDLREQSRLAVKQPPALGGRNGRILEPS